MPIRYQRCPQQIGHPAPAPATAQRRREKLADLHQRTGHVSEAKAGAAVDLEHGVRGSTPVRAKETQKAWSLPGAFLEPWL